jgi:hypothetical protein
MDVKVIMNTLTASARDKVRFVFIDSHRPIHHSFNDDNDTNFVIFHDPDGGDIPVNAIPSADAALEPGAPIEFHFDFRKYRCSFPSALYAFVGRILNGLLCQVCMFWSNLDTGNLSEWGGFCMQVARTSAGERARTLTRATV